MTLRTYPSVVDDRLGVVIVGWRHSSSSKVRRRQRRACRTAEPAHYETGLTSADVSDAPVAGQVGSSWRWAALRGSDKVASWVPPDEDDVHRTAVRA